MKCEMLSASSVKLYEQCPLRYHARYELGKKSGSTPQIGAGLIAHKILELYYRPDSKLTKEECFNEACKSEFCPDREQFEAAKKMAFDLISEEPREITNAITTELNFEFYLESGACAHGFIDRLDLFNSNTIRIVDYKTGEFSPSVEELAEDHQTNIYAAWVFLNEKFNDIDNVLFNYKYIRTGLQKTIKINREQTNKYLEYFDHIFHAIRNDEKHLPHLNSFCWNCEHRGDCNEYKSSFAIVKTIGCSVSDDISSLSAEELVDAYNNASNISTCIDKEKKLISSWLVSMLNNVSTGKIDTGKSVVKLTSRKMPSVSGSSAKELVKKHGLVEKALEMLSASDLEKLIKGNADARADYEKIVTQKSGISYPVVSKKKV